MGIRMRDISGALRTISTISMRDATATLRSISRVRMRDAAGTLRTVFDFFTVTLSTSSMHGYGSGAAISGSVVTDPVTSTVSGGAAPYTYFWQFVSGDEDIVIDTPTADDTTFSAASVYESIPLQGLFRLRVTDNGGQLVVSSNVNIVLHWIDTT